MRAEWTQAAQRAGKQRAPAQVAGSRPPARSSPLARLQRGLGNQAFGDMHRLSPIQAKLKVGAPNDRFEREADRVADQVMRMPLPGGAGLSEAPRGIQRSCAACAAGGAPCPKCGGETDEIQRKPLAATITPLVQRQGIAPEEPEEQTLQAKAAPGTAGVSGGTVASSVAPPSTGGQPLSAGQRAFFEPRFGVDFSAVRIHRDARAAAAARGLSARAYTLGRDVVFGQGQYRPDSAAGRHLMAHELTHVVQQGKAGGHDRAAAGRPGLSASPPVVQRACIGAIRAPEPCTAAGGDIVDVAASNNDIYTAERECDHFLPGEEARLSGDAASRISPGDAVTVHGFASQEGDPTFNDALSCARANTAAGVLRGAMTAGSPPRITLLKHGATPGDRPDRRSVVIQWPAAPAPTPTPTPAPTAPTASTTSPAQLAVTVLKAHGTGFDTSHLTVDLLEGIFRAEAGVLVDRLISSSSVGDTQGPGQLGEDEINDVDSTFRTASKKFAAVYPGPPGSWKAKTNDPNWAYFYTAATYLMKLDVAQSKFQPSTALMTAEGAPGTKISDAAMGIHELGLVTFHGGFDRMAAYRRRIAGDTATPLTTTPEEDAFRARHGITAGFKRWQVAQDLALEAIRQGLFFRDDEDPERLREMETYLQNVAGGFDFDFDISASLDASRRFYVANGSVEITVLADYQFGPPGNAPAHRYQYFIQLYSDPSGTFSSQTPYPPQAYQVGKRETRQWTNLPAGHYRFSVRQPVGDILHGDGRVEFD